MFWRKKMLESLEFLKLYKEMQEIRIKVEMMALELDLTKKKLRISKGIPKEEIISGEMGETQTNKNPSIFLSPNGLPI